MKSYEMTTFSDNPVPFLFLCYIHILSEVPDIMLSHEHSEVLWIAQDEIGSVQSWRGGFDSIAKKAFTTYLF